MTSITTGPSTSGRQKHSLRIDMTPLVDLGFLLITFFVFTATLSQPHITRLIMPKEGDSTPVAASVSLTLLLGNSRVYVYEGEWKEAGSTGAIGETGYHWRTGIGESIRQKQASLTERNELVVLIKPLAATSYQNVINALDEMQINDVKKYAIVEPSAEERTYVQGAELSTYAQPGVTVK